MIRCRICRVRGATQVTELAEERRCTRVEDDAAVLAGRIELDRDAAPAERICPGADVADARDFAAAR